ncbi:hypothetical protein FAES_4639 [Fibrella aestuarina BUZ 2]|uniref:Uncharacterized protein n=1 Tax=Fibrella aestuarina BUZ 2 TaxID=1166018 RepID=I0KET5_9BACT|nr:hypothetical protein [Fibrella aestuarina]CCH02638.1 hypothetical protein FAES_4639 [Fibrella aestuarina BUZ 2]
MILNQANRHLPVRHQKPLAFRNPIRGYLLAVLVVFGVLGCQHTRQDSATSTPTDTGSVAVTDDTVPSPSTRNDGATGDTVRVSLGKEASPLTLTMRSDSLHPTVICALQVAEAGTLLAQLVPSEKDQNIRFSQIYLPNGTTDGPFGQTLTYPLKQAGLVRLRMSPSQMASGPSAGTFTIKLQLK